MLIFLQHYRLSFELVGIDHKYTSSNIVTRHFQLNIYETYTICVVKSDDELSFYKDQKKQSEYKDSENFFFPGKQFNVIVKISTWIIHGSTVNLENSSSQPFMN